MKSVAVKMLLVGAALGAGVFAFAGTANATHVSAVITVPDQATVGQPMEVRATLHSADDGLPLAGTAVIFYMDASFSGVSGEVELGMSVTDENGLATLSHEPRSASVHQIRAEFLPPGDSEPEVITKSISVTDTGSQLHRSTAGVQIPGLNVWLLMALVSVVWAILLTVALRVVAIAHAGGETEADAASSRSGVR